MERNPAFFKTPPPQRGPYPRPLPKHPSFPQPLPKRAVAPLRKPAMGTPPHTTAPPRDLWCPLPKGSCPMTCPPPSRIPLYPPRPPKSAPMQEPQSRDHYHIRDIVIATLSTHQDEPSHLQQRANAQTHHPKKAMTPPTKGGKGLKPIKHLHEIKNIPDNRKAKKMGKEKTGRRQLYGCKHHH